MSYESPVFRTLAASNHAKDQIREEHDFYATEPKAVELLLEQEKFEGKILEPCCGTGDISKVLEANGYEVISSDLIDRGYGEVKDFFEIKEFEGNIITNTPYRNSGTFARHALEIIPEGKKVALFVKLLFLEGKERKKLFEDYPPKTVYVSSSRLTCAKNGDFEKYVSSAVAYAWVVWEKGYAGETILRWIN